jgi:hypothetical protein
MPCKECDNGKYKWGNGDCKYDTLQECENAHQNYDIVELIVDENNEELAIDAISLVTSPAIETDFVYFNATESNLTLAKVNEEQRLLVSPALIPYKQIYRYDANKDRNYYVYFTADTVRKAAEAYMKHHNTNNATLQHEEKVTGVHTVESWIVEDSKNDKSNLYGYELPKGTWFVSMRVNNDEVWERIKSGELKGLSIEGYFVDKMEKLSLEQEPTDEEILLALADILDLESYTDYPESASNNAKKAIEYKEKNGSDCGTQVGWTRARQLADRKPISRDTIARMASFKRHQQHKDVPYSEGCGGLMYDAWGGTSGIEWAIRKLDQIDRK